ncbi:MAG: transposase [Deltaproteobacteria bacterium]|nr:transposase [Deltaproteobacteria bacterium]
MEKEILKGTLWSLLKNPGNLDKSGNEQQRLQEALELNQPLATAYYMKEDLRQFWSQPNKSIAEAFLNNWFDRASYTDIQLLKKIFQTWQPPFRSIGLS